MFNLPNTATLEDVKRVYRKLALTNHPDKGGDPEKFKNILNYYELLTKYLQI